MLSLVFGPRANSLAPATRHERGGKTTFALTRSQRLQQPTLPKLLVARVRARRSARGELGEEAIDLFARCCQLAACHECSQANPSQPRLGPPVDGGDVGLPASSTARQVVGQIVQVDRLLGRPPCGKCRSALRHASPLADTRPRYPARGPAQTEANLFTSQASATAPLARVMLAATS